MNIYIYKDIENNLQPIASIRGGCLTPYSSFTESATPLVFSKKPTAGHVTSIPFLNPYR